MGIEVNSYSAICSKCGKAYGRRKGNFPVNYGLLYKGVGYISVCKECIDTMYNSYLSQCNNARNAVRQMCRKLDLYWSDKVFDIVDRMNTTSTMMTSYIAKINTVSYSGKSYDDTLAEEGNLWIWNFEPIEQAESVQVISHASDMENEDIEIPDEVIAFWGTGNTPEMYQALEQRRSYWMSKFPKDYEPDIGTEAIIRQICSLELDINRDRAAGRAVDKSINALNALLGSASLKPAQKKADDVDSVIDKTPLGVWAKKLENERPIKEADPELQDVDGIVRYISVWFLGHLCKMLGIKNTYCKLYEEEIAKIRVERPEYDDDDDETLFNDIFASDKAESTPEGGADVKT